MLHLLNPDIQMPTCAGVHCSFIDRSVSNAQGKLLIHVSARSADGNNGWHMLQALFRRGQLKALVDLHSETEGLGGQLAAEEINVIRGALDLTNKTAAKGMTPLEKVRLLGGFWEEPVCCPKADEHVAAHSIPSFVCLPVELPPCRKAAF